MTFALDPRLGADTLPAGHLPLCEMRLMNDARFPWLILVPRRAGARELHDLCPADRAVLMEEANAASAVLAAHGAFKVNVGALGNIVAQLHVHVVARQPGDAAWPGPVWGAGKRQPYDGEAGQALAHTLSQALGTQEQP